MTNLADHESLLAERFAALATPDPGDWPAVDRRARRQHRRRSISVAAVLVAAVAVAAPALGLHRVGLDWLQAEPAPPREQLEFVQLGVGAPAGMDPGVIPDSARKVMEVRVDGRRSVLWVAPTRGGGFCVHWTTFFGGGCLRDRALPTVKPRDPDDVGPFLLGATWSPDERGVLQRVSGHVIAPETDRLLLEYADGGTAELPLVWVSAPIDAGFYGFRVPDEHREVGHQVTALVAEDADGNVLARQMFRLTAPAEIRGMVRLPDGQIAHLPAKALVGEARKLISFRAENGRQVTAWLVPTADGGHCYVFNRGSGCPPPGSEAYPLGAGMHGGSAPLLIAGEVGPDVAIYELRYQDGDVERIEPVEGFVLHEVPSRHYAPGHRLELFRALDRDGKLIEERPYSTDSPGVYPCDRPVDIGHGLMACP